MKKFKVSAKVSKFWYSECGRIEKTEVFVIDTVVRADSEVEAVVRADVALRDRTRTDEHMSMVEITDIGELKRKPSRMPMLRLSDSQWEGLGKDVRRTMLEQLMIVETTSYRYSLGCRGDWWLSYRHSKRNGDEAEIVDEWR